MMLHTSSVAASFGRLDGALTVFEDGATGGVAGLIPMLRRAEVVASSRLDGNQASLINLMDSEAGLAVAGPARDVAELCALNEVAGRVIVTESPTAWLLEVHGALMKRLGHPGVGWRTAPLWIGASGATREESRHIPPSPDQIPALMQEWQQSMQMSAMEEPLVKLSRSLAALETIHPFTEANARVARLWLQQGLIQSGFLRHPVLLWSPQLQQRGRDARQAVQALRAGKGDDPWTPLFISLLRQAADETTDLICRAAALRARHRRTIISDFGRSVPQALRLADALVAAPLIDIKGVMELTGVTFPAANDLVRRFERSGLLVEVTGNTRNRRFRYAPFVRIFLDDE
jgi:Fic family protein